MTQIPTSHEPFTLSRDAAGHLVLHRPEQEDQPEVRVTRCFPWSIRDRYLAIRNKKGEEVLLLSDLEEVASDSRALIEQELEAQDFIPRITGIDSIDDRFDVMEWQVATDRGPVCLQIRSNDDIRQLDDGRVLIRDYAGGVFEVAGVDKLDERSSRMLLDHLG